MARRYHEIKGLAEFSAKTIVSDEEQWKKFLHTAGHMYKYPFREQMLNIKQIFIIIGEYDKICLVKSFIQGVCIWPL